MVRSVARWLVVYLYSEGWPIAILGVVENDLPGHIQPLREGSLTTISATSRGDHSVTTSPAGSLSARQRLDFFSRKSARTRPIVEMGAASMQPVPRSTPAHSRATLARMAGSQPEASGAYSSTPRRSPKDYRDEDTPPAIAW